MPLPPVTPAVKPLTGPQKVLRKLGLVRPIDLALHLPLRYEDETRLVKLRDVREGEVAQLEGRVTHAEVKLGGHRQLLVTLDDGSGTCLLRFFTFYPSQQKALAVGNLIRVRGEIRGGFAGLTMMHPVVKPAGGELATALTPVYPTAAGLPQAYLRRAVQAGLARAELPETVPAAYLQEIGLKPVWNLRQALSFLHNPTPDVSLDTLQDHSHPAWQRLKAEELLAQQLSQLQSRRSRARLRSPALSGASADSLFERLLATLPFQLTTAQRRVVAEINRDLARPAPMHRLLQGDVGAGKTVVAALAAAQCMGAGWQCALMAPTEILATQHFAKLVDWLQPLGVTVAWLTGSQKAKERREMLALIASGQAALVVGTHALIQGKVQFHKLALAIIDEQHRFGVAQRLALREKLGSPDLEPHLLMMTATPIPRTLAMSYYADLDVSTIDELPPGRTPIVTRVIHDARRDEVIARISDQLVQGRQIYWVCPLIEESEALDLRNATETHAQLSAALPGVLVGLLHSRMPVLEKKVVMSLFVGGQMGVLVSTTVIEVGVDVPNASLMVIEHAERFGLSQLHQLRGRVGRGAAASACVLLYATGDAPRLGETARARLKAMAQTSDGFEIARRDLEIRGPGEVMGARQSGDAMLRFADVVEDARLLDWARHLAPLLLDQHPALAAQHVQRWLGGKTDYLNA
ncbi:ATP-dependent DNA helicase RecG [Rhodoferax sp.]|uniref:ATP-dependent DNA helicase RecG n=1 Tax=Rhodoferax sp. TaxID=50421 RepID=UPI00272F0517|nr:ATP-dependent DNA helicase RecG [Rhodoferax sp.]MDP1528209.1 ATP-dependent DNA helicase RecG [Rhodoferax sp.]MDP1943084.1 ATP-dependent DNA helicase RecG [Rhodoferax sp.]MDP2443102.1 ATP-dependent DNA helicase RecG [Rhodoferax sp.]MDZ4206627.1 ATP-dependent DNA helicase RecG [Rhodoferax sp.]